MLKEAIEKIAALALEGTDLKYYTRKNGSIEVFQGKDHFTDSNPLPGSALEFSALTALADYVKSTLDKPWREKCKMVIVDSPTSVRLASEADPVDARRFTLAAVKPVLPAPHPFGKFISGEDFMICIQSRFVHAYDYDTVVSSCAGIRRNEGAEYKDSGVTQTVTVQSGLSLAATKQLPNPVVLAPYRTFPEVSQPASAFTLRVTDGKDAGPLIGLWEADGGAWQLEAMQRIQAWLAEALDGQDITILA